MPAPTEPRWLGTIRALLTELDISQGQFAEQIGIRRETVSRWFHGEEAPNPSRETIDKILQFCRESGRSTTYEELFGPVELPAAANE